jgi:hypothetical protein
MYHMKPNIKMRVFGILGSNISGTQLQRITREPVHTRHTHTHAQRYGTSACTKDLLHFSSHEGNLIRPSGKTNFVP